MKIIWHYTTLWAFKSIWADQEIKLSEIEKFWGWNPAVWFSKRSDWEPTATRMMRCDKTGKLTLLTIQEQYEMLGMVRIGIEFKNDLVTWENYKFLSNIDPERHREMTERGIKKNESFNLSEL